MQKNDVKDIKKAIDSLEVFNSEKLILANDNGCLIYGRGIDLFVLLTVIIKAMHDKGLKDKELYDLALDLGSKSEKELEKSAFEILKAKLKGL